MGQPNDKQLLKKFTAEVMATRNPVWGWLVGRKHCVNLKYCPIIVSLVKDGILTMKRERFTTNVTYNVIRHPSPTIHPDGIPCPVCKGLCKRPPELSMDGHTKDCRFHNYYSKGGAELDFG